jgi:hypothetical protein
MQVRGHCSVLLKTALFDGNRGTAFADTTKL